MPPASIRRLRPRACRTLLAGAICAALSCNPDDPFDPVPRGSLAPGSWGGPNAGVLVDDSVAHVHVGCTFGDFDAAIELDRAGRFTVPGSYLLRAYPIAVGPTLPATFSGSITGRVLVLRVLVNDTVEKKLVALGPVTVKFGEQPQLGPCPICVREPAGRARIAGRMLQPLRRQDR
jgi:hypothetical protein